MRSAVVCLRACLCALDMHCGAYMISMPCRMRRRLACCQSDTCRCAFLSPLGRLWTALYAVGIEVARASLAQAARARIIESGAAPFSLSRGSAAAAGSGSRTRVRACAPPHPLTSEGMKDGSSWLRMSPDERRDAMHTVIAVLAASGYPRLSRIVLCACAPTPILRGAQESDDGARELVHRAVGGEGSREILLALGWLLGRGGVLHARSASGGTLTGYTPSLSPAGSLRPESCPIFPCVDGTVASGPKSTEATVRGAVRGALAALRALDLNTRQVALRHAQLVHGLKALVQVASPSAPAPLDARVHCLQQSFTSLLQAS